MTQLFFTSTIEKDEGLIQKVMIHFDYFLPEYHRDWQDKLHGSIQIIQVLDESLSPLPQTITELIRIRRRCWDYLERKDLLIPNNIIPLWHHPNQ